MNLDDLKNEILSIPPDAPALIYIGVGAASSANQNNVLPPENYQQFPPFLQDLHNQVPNLHTFLLLIDPQQENPPKVAIDYHLQGQNKSDQYNSDQNNSVRLQAFVYRLSVYADPYLKPKAGGLNITSSLSDLNQFARENGVTIIYHDFSGRRVSLLAEHFDQENKDHLDQIVYGLSAREDHGCFFDLTQDNAYFPYRLQADRDRRPILKLFNYYKYSVNHTYEEIDTELAKFPPSMHPLAVVQKNQIINTIRNDFKNSNLSVLRQIHKLVQSAEGAVGQSAEGAVGQSAEGAVGQSAEGAVGQSAEGAGLQSAEGAGLHEKDEQDLEYQSTYLFNDLPKFFRKMFADLFKEKEYRLLYELLFNYTASELDIIAKLKPMDMSGEEILTFITLDEDPYKWYNAIGGLI